MEPAFGPLSICKRQQTSPFSIHRTALVGMDGQLLAKHSVVLTCCEHVQPFLKTVTKKKKHSHDWLICFQQIQHCFFLSRRLSEHTAIKALQPISWNARIILSRVRTSNSSELKMVETSSWNQRYFSEPPQLIVRLAWYYRKPFWYYTIWIYLGIIVTNST